MKAFINECLKGVFLESKEVKVFSGQVAEWQLSLNSQSNEYLITIGELSDELRQWLKNQKNRSRQVSLRVPLLPNGDEVCMKWKFKESLLRTLGEEVAEQYCSLDLYSEFECPESFLEGSSVKVVQLVKSSEGFERMSLKGVELLKVYLSKTLGKEVVWRKLEESETFALSLHGSYCVKVPESFQGQLLLDGRIRTELDKERLKKSFVIGKSGKLVSLTGMEEFNSDKTLGEALRERFPSKVQEYCSRTLGDLEFLKVLSLIQELGEEKEVE